MTAWTLFVQFLIDYMAYFIIVGIVVVGLIAANVVWAVLAYKKRKQKMPDENQETAENT